MWITHKLLTYCQTCPKFALIDQGQAQSCVDLAQLLLKFNLSLSTSSILSSRCVHARLKLRKACPLVVVGRNSSNTVAWVFKWKANPYNFQSHFMRFRSCRLASIFHFVTRLDSPIHALARQGVNRFVPWVHVIM